MARLVIIPPKSPNANVPVTMNFQDQAQFGEVLGSAAIEVSVFQGEDANPDAIKFGPANIDGYNVTQLFTAGVPGVIYQLTFFVFGSDDHIYSRDGKLAILSDTGGF